MPVQALSKQAYVPMITQRADLFISDECATGQTFISLIKLSYKVLVTPGQKFSEPSHVKRRP